MKKFLRKIHHWLGIFSGLFVFVIAITGCIYAFQEEIQNATQPYRFIKKENKDFMLPSLLEQISKRQLPNKTLHSIKYYTENKSAQAIFYHYEPTYYYIVYLNPYTGEILHTQNMQEGFFPFILKGHFYLWLPEKIGQPVVSILTLIFLINIIVGLVLWLPKNYKILKNRIWFRWKNVTQWKRRNFDLHAIIGFYSFNIALIFAITGLVWGFQWFASGYYNILGGKKVLIYEEPKSVINESKNIIAIDYLYKKSINENTNVASIELHPPETDSSVLAININTESGTYWKIDYLYYDQYSLIEKNTKTIFNKYREANFADKLLRMNYDIHTGAILGIWGKIFMFLMSLLIASLPITGILFWIGRVRKK